MAPLQQWRRATASAVTMRIASRGSMLALWQAEHARARLLAHSPADQIEIHVVHTTGDRVTAVPLAAIGDRGLFTREVDRAVLDGDAQFAVHSFKDVPTRLEEGLALGAVLEREDPRDAYLPGPGRPRRLTDLPCGARVGTSSLRRRALLLAVRPDLEVVDLRGNLDTRLRRLAAGDYDAIILARAGVRRLGRDHDIGEVLPVPAWLPAVGQGALALVARADDDATLARLRPLDHAATRIATSAERAFLARLEGGCQIPIGALADMVPGQLHLAGLVAALDGSEVVRGELEGSTDAPELLGTRLAEQLLHRGADAVLRAIRAVGRVTDVPPPAAP